MKSVKKPNYPRSLTSEQLADIFLRDILKEDMKAFAQAMANPVRGSSPSPFVLSGDSPEPYVDEEESEEDTGD